jgi:hypothetical protein
MRRLLVTRRQIALDRLEEYIDGWDKICREAMRLGGHAWLFRAAEREDQFLEFIEWLSDTAPTLPEDPDLLDAQIAVDESFGPGHTEDWIEA